MADYSSSKVPLVILALLWGSLFVGALAHIISPFLVPIEPRGFVLSERLIRLLSGAVLAVLYFYITRKRRWALITFSLYYLLSLYFSLRLFFYLLVLIGPISLVLGIQIVAQGLAIGLCFRRPNRALFGFTR